jgi:hypothetical protein
MAKFSYLEEQLKKVETYKWTGPQNNMQDDITRFVYDTWNFDEIIKRIQKEKEINPNFPEQYAINRWYNFWTSKGAEAIFKKNKRVKPEQDKSNKTIDFYIENNAFDLKVSVMPKDLCKAKNDPIQNMKHWKDNFEELIKWFYGNQSRESRYHEKSRIFLVCYDLYETQNNWKLKRELILMNQLIDFYLDNFDAEKTPKIKIGSKETIADALIFAKIKEKFWGFISKSYGLDKPYLQIK